MLIIVFLYAAINLASSKPVLPSTINLDIAAPVTVFGHELPDCVNVAPSRTVQDIIWSCLATIFACTWVAVHPNIPRPNDSGWRKYWERALVMVYAILSPEFVNAWALRQWRGAVRHAAKYNWKHHGVPPPSSYLWWYIECWFRQDEKPDLWTIRHGFLLEMDGLVNKFGVPIRSVDDEILDPLDISEEEICDKSKGDFLTKLLVILQTTWFIFQCLTRWITHLPVTELEVVTLAFALLNVGTYCLWWNKPQNVGLAIQMDRYRRPKNHLQEQKWVGGGDVGGTVQGTPSEAGSGQNVDRVLGGQPNQRSGFLGRVTEVIQQLVRCLHTMGIVTVALHPRHLRSLIFGHIVEVVTGPFPRPLCAILGVTEDGKFGHIFYSSRESDPAAPLYAVIIGTVFGGLHLIPLWSSSFPSSPEKHLWKLSTLFIIIDPFLLLCLSVVGVNVRHVALKVIFFTLILGSIALYAVARIIHVVIAFTTLRDLPPDAFRDVTWTTFLPHL